MKIIRISLLFLFLSFNSSVFAQIKNPIHWVIGINAGGEYLYPNTETNPVGINFGIFQQFSIKDFSVAAGITFGQREIYDKLVNRVNSGSFNFTSTRIRHYQERSLTSDIFIKYYPPVINKKHLIFVGFGVQFKNPSKVMGESTNTNTSNFFPDYTVMLRGVENKRGYRLGIGVDHLMSEKIFISGKLGWNFFVDQNDSRVNPENLTYTGGNNNFFLEIQLGYNLKKSYSLFRG